MSTLRIESELTIETHAAQRRVREAQQYLSIPLQDIQSISCYLFSAPISKEALRQCFINDWKDIFVDTVLETLHLQPYPLPVYQGASPSHIVEVGFRPGVTDNVARSAEEALGLCSDINITVATAKLYYLFGTETKEQAEQIATTLLGNTLIHNIQIWSAEEFVARDRFDQVQLPTVQLAPFADLYHTVDISRPIDTLLEQSKESCWALNGEELSHIQQYFSTTELAHSRAQHALPPHPTDVEMEIIAQSWSEHCKHKIFAANISYTEEQLRADTPALGSLQINSLFKTFVRQATLDIEAQRGIDWLRSIFHDNAGVVRFDPHVDLAIKVETHNSPSALDPYGGAITGILGVNRDIIGVGMGARPIANMDVFCFADPKWPLAGDEDRMPVGLLQPRRLLEGVHKGVEDGGNKSGIPTVNGAIFFDQDYAGKPLVFVGTVGVMPHTLPNTISGVHKAISVGDRIVMVGGAIGADGIHGATFSSMELDEHAPATAVQIGDPITQKRALDFLMEARDLGLFSCLTDNGAGGLSSSVGEMATLCNGASIDLQKAPTKYPGLKPWELMISESQERMTVAVPPANLDDFLELAAQRGVQATDIGVFSDSGFLDVFYGETRVACLDLDFLHESLPSMNLKAVWDGPRKRNTWIDRDDRSDPHALSLIEITKILLNRPNIRSKESWVRQYDHEVQGATHIKPFGGKTTSGPNDSGVIWLYPHGGAKDAAVSIGCGLSPRISLFDPYKMAQFAVDEAIRNVVATGGDIDHTCVLDNFCWPDPVLSAKTPDGDYKLGQLVRTCKGLYDICTTYGTPLVSGKDSMKNDFRGKNARNEELTISILPTLLVTAMSKTRIGTTQTSAFKQSGDIIYRIGNNASGMAGSEFASRFYLPPEEDILPHIDLASNLLLYRRIHTGLQSALFSSIHDISDGGLLCALIESGFGNMIGMDITIQNASFSTLFSEGPGQFVVSIPSQKEPAFRTLFSDLEIERLGITAAEPIIRISTPETELCSHPLEELFQSWQEEL